MTNIVQHVFSWKMMKKLHMKIGAFWPQQLLGRFSGLEIPPLSKKIREGKRRGGEGREGKGGKEGGKVIYFHFTNTEYLLWAGFWSFRNRSQSLSSKT